MTTDKTPATLSVDVRQWLGDERFMYEPGTQSRAKCDEAFAAVAELIEADAAYDKAYAAAVGNPADEVALTEAEDRRAAALARVKGESA